MINLLSMMVCLCCRNRSFIYGVAVASITWTISIILYAELTDYSFDSDSNKHSEINRPNSYKRDKKSMNMVDSNDLDDWNSKKGMVKPSKGLLKKLKPVPVRNSFLRFGFGEKSSELGMVKTPEDQKIRDDGYKSHAFNTLVSSRLPYDREMPDVRHEMCFNKTFSSHLPAASIVICFYNEEFHTLVRTVTSVLNRSPANILHEIIVVDDWSEKDDIYNKFKKYSDKHFPKKVKLLRTDKREGLMRARLIGARNATGEFLVFLDSHCEVTVQWLEPLIETIENNPTIPTVVTPIIDIISSDTFLYTAASMVRGGFNWGLHFMWDSVPKSLLVNVEDFAKPIVSPTMAGGLFAIRRSYFRDIGEYDMGMEVWGGENLELSFRIWLCGGQLLIVPCSRVGHVFRKRRPYGSIVKGQDTQLRNALRLAHVWLDEYKEHFFQVRPEARNLKYGDISSRLQLRKELKCKSFSWYLENVYPELRIPDDPNKIYAKVKKKLDVEEAKKPVGEVVQLRPWNLRERTYINSFQIRLSGTTMCLQSEKGATTKGARLLIKGCKVSKEQVWSETDRHEIVLGKLLCLDAGNKWPKLSKCHEMGESQEWKLEKSNHIAMYNAAAGMCLSASKAETGAQVMLDLCSKEDKTRWDILLVNTKKFW